MDIYVLKTMYQEKNKSSCDLEPEYAQTAQRCLASIFPMIYMPCIK